MVYDASHDGSDTVNGGPSACCWCQIEWMSWRPWDGNHGETSSLHLRPHVPSDICLPVWSAQCSRPYCRAILRAFSFVYISYFATRRWWLIRVLFFFIQAQHTASRLGKRRASSIESGFWVTLGLKVFRLGFLVHIQLWEHLE